jgi:hypothetical protein
MDTDMLTTFDDEAMDQVSGGSDPKTAGEKLGTFISGMHEIWEDAVANSIGAISDFWKGFSNGLKNN